MCDSRCVVDLQLLKDCLYSFNELPNRRLSNGVSTYELVAQINRVLAQTNTSVYFSWDVEYVQEVRENLTDEQALKILKYVESKHDANVGVNWDVLRDFADMLFPLPYSE